MKTFQYTCLNCGEQIPIDYREDNTFVKPLNCPKCNTYIDIKRVSDIIYDILNPPDNVWTDKPKKDKNKP